jgi:ATP-binding cassette subfamily B protein
MKTLFRAYNRLMGILFKEAPLTVIMTILMSVVVGAIPPISLWVNQQMFDNGIGVAQGEISFANYTPILLIFLITNILPLFIKNIYINGYVRIRSQLIFLSSFKNKMLIKCKKLRYEHFENDESLEIIEKAYSRAEGSANAMFPGYISIFFSSIVSSVGFIIQLLNIKWWLLLTIIPIFIIQTVVITKKNKNIYDELETYWNKEKQYGILASYLRSRDYNKEIKLFEIAPYLIDTYGQRLNGRNREYEKYYFKHLKKNLVGYNISDLAVILNSIIFLFLFLQGSITVGLFISLTALMIGGARSGIYKAFSDSLILFNSSGYHINFFNYYERYFSLSEKPDGVTTEVPKEVNIELKDVWFKYPGTDKHVLRGINMKMCSGEKVSLVGENGEGKSTLVKLLLGLFFPDKGMILLNGRDLYSYTQLERSKIFAPIFQDFTHYSFTLRENIGAGYIEQISDDNAINTAAHKGGVDRFIDLMPEGYNTILNRDFEGGVDISGGQWQRIAIARAFMGDKPFFILDEPTSQLDPMAESKLYDEFANMVSGKSALFITHRLASTKITDKIFVIKNGTIIEEGSHDGLMQCRGIYFNMFNAQKRWYENKGGQNYEG